MWKVRRLIAATAFWLLLPPFASNAQAQKCLFAFARFFVSDTEGKPVPDVTIELLGEVPEKVYAALAAEARKRDIYNQDFKLLPPEVKETVKRSIPMSRGGDLCGNPFKQRANSTKVKRWHKGEASTENFGFCNAVGHQRQPFLLKISAPGYVTDYYVGKYLTDCLQHVSAVMSKKEKLMKKPKLVSIPK
ncbi:MAG TPA: hypothetical protein VER76_03365 [Pyrinomonadaceae bacterium]|nr:hypothetical protein [Pyrinomonadaceae bacterium]